MIPTASCALSHQCDRPRGLADPIQSTQLNQSPSILLLTCQQNFQATPQVDIPLVFLRKISIYAQAPRC